MDPGRPEMNVLEAILARRSVRAYSARAVDRSLIDTLLEAAVRAPTAVHEEPWAFVVVQDHRLLLRLSDFANPLAVDQLRPGRALDIFAEPGSNIFHGAGTLIVICAKPLGPFVAADCWLAAENLMLAACALGLGTCVIGSAVPALNLPDVKADLGIPAELSAVAPIIVGYPSAETPPRSRKEPVVLAWR